MTASPTLAGAVVSLCDRTGIALRPWAEAGFRCIAVDVRPGRDASDVPDGSAVGNACQDRDASIDDNGSAAADGSGARDGWGIERHVCDVRTLPHLAGRPLGVLAFPPCTDLASVGSLYWRAKGRRPLLRALAIADACLRVAVRSRADWWLVENPSGRLSTFWGPPDHVFSPHEYGGYLAPGGDAYTKRTCLWVGGGFVMPQPRPVEPVEGSLVGVVSSVDRRDETPRGFARAVFLANVPIRHPSGSSDALPAGESSRPGLPLRPDPEPACECCGRRFRRGRRDQRFCSSRCRVRAHAVRRQGQKIQKSDTGCGHSSCGPDSGSRSGVAIPSEGRSIGPSKTGGKPR